MGIYHDQILPRVIDKVLDNPEIEALRRRAVEGLRDTIVEIGFGSGLNVPLYPSGVTTVLAVDPAVVGRKLSAGRVAHSPARVDFVGLDGQRLPLGDASVDHALSTFTLCTVPDPALALAEIRRVLRPGGTFHFCEHGLSPDPRVARRQRRIEPLNRRLAGGCHLTRDHEALLRAAGFEVTRLDREYGKGPKPYTYHYVGVAQKPL